MAGSIKFTNHEFLVRSFDRNNNKVMDELQVDERIKSKVDTDNNGQISSHELVSALKADAVEIKSGVITESKGFNIYTHGLETLKNVRSTATHARGSVWTPMLSSEDTPETRFNKLVDSNRAYSSEINSMESALRSIRDMTSNATDATSKALHIQAKTTLQSASWRTWMGVFEDLSSGHQPNDYNLRQLEQANTHFQAAYETLNNTLRSIAEQTKDLPDVQAAISATDGSIARAFSNIAAIKNDSQSAQDVSTKLNRIADETQAKATGRTAPFGGVGAGIGAVAGAAIGFFAGGRNPMKALYGGLGGAALGGGVGALVGHSIDMKYVGEAESLRKLSGDVRSYNPDAEQNKLVDETQNTYNQMLNARESHDLDNARVQTNSFNSILGRVKPIEQQSSAILGAYQKK